VRASCPLELYKLNAQQLNNRQDIFFERENYIYCLRLLKEHLIKNVVDIVAYCLMPNHYHLLV
jgi:REP element-mobilizing transposase RayT